MMGLDGLVSMIDILRGVLTLPQYLELIEKEQIEMALHDSEGDKDSAAKKLGINRTTLHEKIRRLQISVDNSTPAFEKATREVAELRARIRFIEYFLKG